jgi:hypothetical protein
MRARMKLRFPSDRARHWLFWIVVLALIGLRLVLRSDLSLQIVFSPHDDSLYAEHAYALLHGEAFGPYDSRTLIKYPGLSLWLAAMRLLGIPFLLSVEICYVGASVYLTLGLLRAGAHRGALLAGMALYLLNPITFSDDWLRIYREPLDTGLLVLMIGAMAHIFVNVERRIATSPHLSVLAVTFAFSLYLREDNRLLWGLLLLFGIVLMWQLRVRWRAKAAWGLLAAAVLVPAVTAKAYEQALRAFFEERYGLPIIHEFSEGEYPRLLAAIRSIDSKKDNRMVSIPQETLAKLRTEVPMFSRVVDHLPPPGPSSFSCQWHGVCSEWSYGFMLFWLRDAAYEAGVTPTLPAAQAYFRDVTSAITDACRSGKLACADRGAGLLPPMQLRWTRALLDEAWHLAKMSLAPAPKLVIRPPVTYDVPLELGRRIQAITIAGHFDTQWQAATVQPPRDRFYVNPLGDWRSALALPYRPLGAVVLLAALAALAWRLYRLPIAPIGPLGLVACVFGLYALLRFAALSYVAVYMGSFDYRMVFSYYAAGILIAVPFIADTLFAKA